MNIKDKNLISTVLFLLGLSIVLGIISLILLPKSNTKEAGFSQASAYSICNEPENTIDILILGTSQVYSSFSPLEIWGKTGITTYACSTPSQNIYYTEELLHKAFETQKPKLVVLETDVLFAKFDEVDIWNHMIENKIPLLKYHSRWKELTLTDFKFEYDYSKRHLGKGFIYDFRCTPLEEKEYMIPSDKIKFIPENCIFYLERIHNFCKENGTDLIFVSAPSAANWDYSKYNAVSSLANEYGITYIDTNLLQDEIALDWTSDWIDDGKHLNYYGAVKVSEWFGSYVQQMELFTDKSNDADYKGWNDDVIKAQLEIPTNK